MHSSWGKKNLSIFFILRPETPQPGIGLVLQTTFTVYIIEQTLSSHCSALWYRAVYLPDTHNGLRFILERKSFLHALIFSERKTKTFFPLSLGMILCKYLPKMQVHEKTNVSLETSPIHCDIMQPQVPHSMLMEQKNTTKSLFNI